ncbi:MAG: hypothetical protein SOV18_08105 [Eubacteriales bacterium]|nr:hypothetical protein [Eubacteriales bacterium]
MKKITSAFLSVIMLVSLCLLASCNSTQPKEAGELFFDEGGADRFTQSIMETMGIDTSDKSITNADVTASGKSLKAEYGLSLDNLSVGGFRLFDSPVTINAAALYDSASKSASGSLSYGYDTDSVSLLYALNTKNALLKLDGITDKYVKVDLSEIIAAAESSADVSGAEASFPSLDPKNVTETEAELTVSGVTNKVRCLEYVIKGEELASIVHSFPDMIEKELASNEQLAMLITRFDPEGEIGAAFDKIRNYQPKDSESVSIKRYFDVNTPAGCELNVMIADVNVTVKYTTVSDDKGVYAAFEAKVTAEGETVSVTGSGSSSKDGTFALEVTVNAGDEPIKLKLSGKTEKTDAGKTTTLDLSVGSGAVSINIPTTVTVAKSDSEGFDVTVSTEISIPSAFSVKLSASCKLVYTDDKPVLPADSEVGTETVEDVLASNEVNAAIMNKLDKTIAVIRGLFSIDDNDFDSDF